MRSQNNRKSKMCLVALFGLLLLAGCGGSGISKVNYDRVKEGMTLQEVEAILGKGMEQASSNISVPGIAVEGFSVSGMSMSGKSLVWQKGTKTISVMIMNEKVISKAQFGL